MIFLAFNILTSGVPLSMVCAVIGLAAAFYLIGVVVRSPSGNQRMREIAGAVQEGAKAYLNRQVITISSIAVIIFILLFIFKDRPTAIGFVIGAFCSLSAGFIGMRIAVVANVRTTQAATDRLPKPCEWLSTEAPSPGCSWSALRFCRYQFSTLWSRGCSDRTWRSVVWLVSPSGLV